MILFEIDIISDILNRYHCHNVKVVNNIVEMSHDPYLYGSLTYDPSTLTFSSVVLMEEKKVGPYNKLKQLTNPEIEVRPKGADIVAARLDIKLRSNEINEVASFLELIGFKKKV